eukprot:Protomagalhaensia_wolfi_Nauph_80__2614@NODE_275_length_2960_cov_10_585758_g205_i0_p2_GENE_NODE_275_length_2960_cov_10_585758_g205_i0NODE_275_length_2960_cov_10_585758_g205_i0_p2_ORF_typecomplete_len319_score47_38CHD5/PF04420_14/1_6e05Metal_resist/PF13801_6/13Metal_resist/PF13801_6/0_82Metal_resist/PF13801_6/1_6e03_NODE_275_length_2960_cov_10_585758_g205_i013112267
MFDARHKKQTMLLSDLLFLVQLGLYSAFEILTNLQKQRSSPSPQAPVSPSVAETRPTTDSSVVSEAQVAKLDETLHPTYRQLWELRTEARRLDAPSTFVQHAKAARRANALEKQWASIYAGLTPEERERHDMAQPTPKRPAVETPLQSSPVGGPSPFSPSAPGDPTAMFRDLMKKMAEQRRSPASSNTFLPFLRLPLVWIVIHWIVGWAPSLKSLPLFSFPARDFGFFGGPMFPLSWVMTLVPETSTYDYAMDLEVVGSETNFASAPISCRRHLTVSFFMTMFLITAALGHLNQEVSTKGSIGKAFYAVRRLWFVRTE